jgi:hypothetical protein
VKLEFLAFSDYAAVDASGKINLVGIFTRLDLPSVPMKLHRFYVSVSGRAEEGDFGKQQDLHFQLLDPDGQVTALDQKVTLGALPRAALPDSEVVMFFLLEVNQHSFEKYGKYQLRAAVGGELLGTTGLGVRKPGEGGLVPEVPH